MPTKRKAPPPRKWTAAAVLDELVDKYDAVHIDQVDVPGGDRLTRVWCRAPHSRVLFVFAGNAERALINFAEGVDVCECSWRTFRNAGGASNGC